MSMAADSTDVTIDVDLMTYLLAFDAHRTLDNLCFGLVAAQINCSDGCSFAA